MHGVTPREVGLYAESFISDDLWRNRAIGQRNPRPGRSGTDLVSDIEYQNGRLYTDLVRPNTDVFHAVMVTATLPDSGTCSLGIHKPRRASPFRREAADRLQRLLPHLQRAVQVRARLVDAASGGRQVRQALDHAPQAMAMLAHDGRVVALNAAAQRLLDARDGLALNRGGGLQACVAADNARLQATIRSAAATTAGNADGSAAGYIGVTRRPAGAATR
jgi:PAS domain-containing protein